MQAHPLFQQTPQTPRLTLGNWNKHMGKNSHKKQTSNTTHTYHIQPTEVILAKQPKGIRTSPKIQLMTAIDTLKATLLQDARREHTKLPKDSTPNSILIHPSWHIHIATDNLPAHVPPSYATLTNATTTKPNPLKQAGPPATLKIPSPQHTTDNPLDIMEIDGHKHLLHQTIYHVSRWRP